MIDPAEVVPIMQSHEEQKNKIKAVDSFSTFIILVGLVLTFFLVFQD